VLVPSLVSVVLPEVPSAPPELVSTPDSEVASEDSPEFASDVPPPDVSPVDTDPDPDVPLVPPDSVPPSEPSPFSELGPQPNESTIAAKTTLRVMEMELCTTRAGPEAVGQGRFVGARPPGSVTPGFPDREAMASLTSDGRVHAFHDATIFPSFPLREGAWGTMEPDEGGADGFTESFGEANTPLPNASPIQRTLYGHTPGYYFDDEDVTNDVDETPPDLHYAAGMHCADCHVGSDVHGDGRIYSSAKYQVDIGCEDCHGTVRDPVVPGADGAFFTRSGRPLPQLSLQGGRVTLTGIVDGAAHPVAQVADLLDDDGDGTPAMRAAMAPDENGWSHTDSLTCDTCHTSYNQQCIGCHVSFDLRLEQVDYQTGERTPGLTRGSRSTYSLDQVLLGQGPDGRVQTYPFDDPRRDMRRWCVLTKAGGGAR